MGKRIWLAAALSVLALAFNACAPRSAPAPAVEPRPAAGSFFGLPVSEGEEHLVVLREGRAIGEMSWKADRKEGRKLVADLSVEPLGTDLPGLAQKPVDWALRVGFYDISQGKAVEVRDFGPRPVTVRLYCPPGSKFGKDDVVIGVSKGTWVRATAAVGKKDDAGLYVLGAKDVVDEASKGVVAVDLMFVRWPAGDPPISWGKPPGS